MRAIDLREKILESTFFLLDESERKELIEIKKLKVLEELSDKMR